MQILKYLQNASLDPQPHRYLCMHLLCARARARALAQVRAIIHVNAATSIRFY